MKTKLVLSFYILFSFVFLLCCTNENRNAKKETEEVDKPMTEADSNQVIKAGIEYLLSHEKGQINNAFYENPIQLVTSFIGKNDREISINGKKIVPSVAPKKGELSYKNPEPVIIVLKFENKNIRLTNMELVLPALGRTYDVIVKKDSLGNFISEIDSFGEF